MQSKLLLALALMAVSLAGCVSDDDSNSGEDQEPAKPFPVLNQTSYHFVGAGSENGTMEGNNSQFIAIGDYSPTGFTTFEPTIGVTSEGNIFFTNFGGTGRGTHIIRSMDQGQNWTDVGPFLTGGMGQFPSSNDPYVYVDPWTDRIVKFDMHALTTMTLEYSDDEGETWSIVTPAFPAAAPAALDHQTIASVPASAVGLPTVEYDAVMVFCVNRGTTTTGAWCSTSLDGGLTWAALVPGFPVNSQQCSGLHGHVVGSADGYFYRGNPSCSGPAVYASSDGGYTWTESTIKPGGVYGHEVAVAVDEANHVHAFWIGSDLMPYQASSMDHGQTWTEPRMVAPEGVSKVGFPTIEAGAEGRVAFSYIGYNESIAGWNGYIGMMTDAFNETVLVTSVAVNTPDDPLDASDNCGQRRCGGFGDFIDIAIDPEGRPWAALATNVHNQAVIGTVLEGPALRGNLTALPALPAFADF